MKLRSGLTFLLFILLFQNIHAAHEVGNGGGAIVCRKNTQITRSVSYDLWRGENDGVLFEDGIHYLEIKRNNLESAHSQAYKAIERFAQFNSELAKPFKMVLDTVIKKIDFKLSAAKSKRLPTKNDFNPKSLPEEEFCPVANTLPDYETAAIYYDLLDTDSTNNLYNNLYYLKKKHLQKDTIDIYTKVIKHFETNTDLAALYLHEAIYKVIRFTGLADNSDSVADVVALLFSNSENQLLYRKFNDVFRMTIDSRAVSRDSRIFLDPYSPDKFIENLAYKLLELNNIEEIKLAYSNFSVSEGMEYRIIGNQIIKKHSFKYGTGIFGNKSAILTETILSMAIIKLNVEVVKFLLDQDGISASNTINDYYIYPRKYNMLQVAKRIRTKRKSLERVKKNRIIKLLKNSI